MWLVHGALERSDWRVAHRLRPRYIPRVALKLRPGRVYIDREWWGPRCGSGRPGPGRVSTGGLRLVRASARVRAEGLCEVNSRGGVCRW